MIDVLYEDENILAVDKPEGVASIPDRRRGFRCRDQIGTAL